MTRVGLSDKYHIVWCCQATGFLSSVSILFKFSEHALGHPRHIILKFAESHIIWDYAKYKKQLKTEYFSLAFNVY